MCQLELQLTDLLLMKSFDSVALAFSDAQLLSQVVDLDLVVLRAGLEGEVLLASSSQSLVELQELTLLGAALRLHRKVARLGHRCRELQLELLLLLLQIVILLR